MLQSWLQGNIKRKKEVNVSCSTTQNEVTNSQGDPSDGDPNSACSVLSSDALALASKRRKTVRKYDSNYELILDLLGVGLRRLNQDHSALCAEMFSAKSKAITSQTASFH